MNGAMRNGCNLFKETPVLGTKGKNNPKRTLGGNVLIEAARGNALPVSGQIDRLQWFGVV